MRNRLLAIVLGVIGVCAIAMSACSDDPDGKSAVAGPRIDGGPRPSFPSTTPSLTGFSLVDAFPGVEVSGSIAIDWPKGSTEPFVLTNEGTIVRITAHGAIHALDFASSVALDGEGGALGLAVHPKFSDATDAKPYVYVWYNAVATPKNKQRLSRFTWQPETESFDAGSELILVEQTEESTNHNGGQIHFGSDGFLYFGNGDDDIPAGINPNHQTITRALFGGIFRIDVDSQGGAISHAPPRQPLNGTTANYFIPNSNPFVGVPNALEEFFALGLRNPYCFSFDRETGDLWVGDVGDNFREEINRVGAGDNCEYPIREGEIVREPGAVIGVGAARAPVFSYSHAELADLVAIVGGFVYRGSKFPELRGKYIYSDWPVGRIWALDPSTSPPTRTTLVENNWRYDPIGLAQDNDGEIYLLHWERIFTLQRDSSGDQIPRLLSETRLFPELSSLTPHPALVSYEVNSPSWSDGSDKRRWVSVPEGQTIKMATDETGATVLQPPVGTYFVKHFELPEKVRPRERSRRLETRVLVVGAETTYGLSYRWNAQGTDAELVTEPRSEGFLDEAGNASRVWQLPSSGQCWSCHRPENRVLGFTVPQLNRSLNDGTNQLEVLRARAVLDASVMTSPGLVPPSQRSGSLEERAVSYLVANCSPCHHAGRTFEDDSVWDARPGVPLAQRGLLDAPHHNPPMAEALGLGDAPLIKPGDPNASILLARVRTNDPDLRMPPLARNVVDADGASLLEEWIRSLH